eukprot:evm.model.NODE_11302_length_8480_cov_19.054834.2
MEPPLAATGTGPPCSAIDQKLVIFDTLQHPDALRWAADGRLAMLLSNQVEICQYPGEEMEPYFRHHIALSDSSQPRGGSSNSNGKLADVGVLDARGVYKDRDALVYMLQRSTAEAVGGDNVPSMFCALDWSPRGCAWEGGCLLATLTTDSVLVVWAPPKANKACSWTCVSNVTEAWIHYLKEHAYIVPGMTHDTELQALLRGAAAEEQGEGESQGEKLIRDAKKWAARQHVAAIEAVAWAKDRMGRGSVERRKGRMGEDDDEETKPAPSGDKEKEYTLLATGGPRLLVIWVFVDQGEGSSFGLLREEEGGREGEERSLLGLHSEKVGEREGGKERRRYGQPAPVLVTDAVKDISNVAWMPRGKGGGEEGREGGMMLAVGTSFGSVHLLRLGREGGKAGGRKGWRVENLRALCGRDLGSIQTLRFGRVYDEEEDEEGREEGQGVLVVAKDRFLHAWTAPEGTQIEGWEGGREGGHGEIVTGMDWCRAPDGSGPVLLSVGLDGLVKTWRFFRKGRKGGGEKGGEASKMGADGNANLHLQRQQQQRQQQQQWYIEPASDLTSLIPTRPEGLMGLAVSPHSFLLLALARVVEGDEGNRRLLQFNRKLRRNHAVMVLQPLWQTGWRTIVLPETGPELWRGLGWQDEEWGEDDGGLSWTSMDLVLVACLDFTALMEGQVHPDFLAPQGTAGTAGGRRREGGREGGREGPRGQWRVEVDVSRLPEGSEDILAHTAFQRLVGLLEQGKKEGGQGGEKPTYVWQALHAICTHISRKFFQGAPHLMEE